MKGALGMAALVAAANAATIDTPTRVQVRQDTSSSGSSSLPTVTTSGNAFMAGSERFYVRGLDYQPQGLTAAVSDPLATPSICQRDIPYFKQLGINAVRVYTVDNSANHDTCMQALAEAGIYLILDVNTPLYSLSRADPATSYNAVYLQSVFATIDAFAGYTNTLMFLSGNEVLNAPNTTNCAPYVKAVTRDMKQYIGERGYRSIPVGYSAADVSQNQYLMAQYMDCGEDPSRSDFYAINNYEWCDPSSMQTSGWDILVEQYLNYSQPVFLSEYGCITNTRTWAETKALYSTAMTKAISGGNAYEYSQEGNGYGLVTINGNTVTPVGQQFQDYQQALASTPNPSGNGGAHGATEPQQCPGQSADWDTKPFIGSALPACPSAAAQYFQNGAGAGPGLNGKGSQWAGTNSVATASANAGAVTATYGSGAPTSAVNDGSSSTSSSASAAVALGPVNLKPFLACGLAVAASFAFGASLI